ncbi:MAG: hypothetical protein AN188_00793 [Candidatus Methanofastidiosum methylothiophilum]|jgi:hypothetical protein|uniref:Uncharacterized protein n=1 Tax=Candidatus Methanofastidiosum methylothiophilum TaxID=1705564 RepID=A0A150JMR1_9EURY|nr:MAG: hypothetical protein AN188_00793 [Candidatus Methanofastidiosum methylthiophilus]KYC58573.1 MAG: hypothetical protein APG09_00045 [Candidatus Methanofastidiosum methylthiophilus]
MIEIIFLLINNYKNRNLYTNYFKYMLIVESKDLFREGISFF